MRTLVSVCVPAYNEEDVIEALAERLAAVADALSERYDFEFIICENGSRDATWQRLLEAYGRDARFKLLRLSRNFWAEGGVTAALSYASGACAITMNADLQDPPEYIPKLLERWEEGYDHVYCVVASRPGESRFRRFFAHRYYWLMDSVSDSPAPRNVSDFRLVDRAMYETYLRMPERFRVMRYMWPWLGFRSASIETERPARAGGRSSFRFWATFHGAMRHVFAQSRMPIAIIPTVGLGMAVLSFVLLVAAIVRAAFFGVPFDGFGTIVALMLLLFGCLFVFLWMIAEYVGMIFEQVRLRPTFIVAESRGLDGRSAAGDVGLSVADDHERRRMPAPR